MMRGACVCVVCVWVRCHAEERYKWRIINAMSCWFTLSRVSMCGGRCPPSIFCSRHETTNETNTNWKFVRASGANHSVCGTFLLCIGIDISTFIFYAFNSGMCRRGASTSPMRTLLCHAMPCHCRRRYDRLMYLTHTHTRWDDAMKCIKYSTIESLRIILQFG